MFQECGLELHLSWHFLATCSVSRPRSHRAHLHDQSLSWRLSEKRFFEPDTSIHIPHSSTPETSQTLKIWSLDVTSHSSRQFQLKHLEMLQIIIIPQYLPQLVLLLAFENEMHSLCLCPSTIWIWSRTSNWAELSASLPVPVLFRNRCGLWCVDESKDHSLSGIGRHHHALEQHFVCWCFCHGHAACKTALGSVA